MNEFIKLNTDPADVIKLFPELDDRADNENTTKLKEKDLEDALNALIKYLVELRIKIGKSSKEPTSSQENAGSQRNLTQQMELIDTTLLKCYLQVTLSIRYFYFKCTTALQNAECKHLGHTGCVEI